MDELRRYEIFVVFQPDLEDDQLEARIDRVNGFLNGTGGRIIEAMRKGKRRLAYPINKFSYGIDVIYQADLPGPTLETLERQLNLNEDVIRYLIIRREDLDEKGTPARPAAEVVQESVVESTEPVETTETVETPAPVETIELPAAEESAPAAMDEQPAEEVPAEGASESVEE